MTQKLTLRRASKIRSQILNKLNVMKSQMQSKSIVSINISDMNRPAYVIEQSKQLDLLFTQYMSLSETLCNISQKIDNANNQAGIGDLLALRELLLNQISVAQRIVDARDMDVLPDVDSIRERINDARVQLNTAAMRRPDDTLMIGAVNPDLIAQCVDIVRTKQALLLDVQDKLDMLNTSNTIELSDQELAVLNIEKIV